MPSEPLHVPLSVLDLAIVGRGESVRDSLQGSVELAQRAEAAGYRRVWYAEHHNMSSIASSATSVLLAHVAAHTSTIRLGSGGVMLPNHSPLVIAEQFGTLESLHPGRIDLGLGRAPGTDGAASLALRRGVEAAERFPQDIRELQTFLADGGSNAGVTATPGQGTNVPLYILGSSLFGAQLAAQLGLPYGFASHFAPSSLRDAVRLYRERFQPSEQLDRPYVIAGVNAIAADTDDEAQRLFLETKRRRVALFVRGGSDVSDSDADRILASPQGHQIVQMAKFSAIGTGPVVREYLGNFAREADADELIVVHQASTMEARLRSLELTAEACGIAAPAA